MNALLDRAEDPREVLDYSYAQQQELLRRVRRQLADVAAARKRAGTQEARLRRSADRLHGQAEEAVAAHRDELARQALALRSAALDHAGDLRAGQGALHAAEERLASTARRLEAKIEAFRIRKETIKAEYTAARAPTRDRRRGVRRDLRGNRGRGPGCPPGRRHDGPAAGTRGRIR